MYVTVFWAPIFLLSGLIYIKKKYIYTFIFKSSIPFDYSTSLHMLISLMADLCTAAQNAERKERSCWSFRQSAVWPEKTSLICGLQGAAFSYFIYLFIYFNFCSSKPAESQDEHTKPDTSGVFLLYILLFYLHCIVLLESNTATRKKTISGRQPLIFSL